MRQGEGPCLGLRRPRSQAAIREKAKRTPCNHCGDRVFALFFVDKRDAPNQALRLPQASPFPLRRESSEASRGGKRRNSHQSAVFGEAGNGTVVGISELVEVGGVEPPSESTLTGLSPGADGYCGGLAPPVPLPDGKPSRRSGQVRVIMRGTVNSFRTHGRHINDAFPGLWPLRFRRPP